MLRSSLLLSAAFYVLLGGIAPRLLGQTPTPTHADIQWAGDHFEQALNDLLPADDHPGYASYINYRYDYDLPLWEREYAFWIIRDEVAGSDPARWHWIARISMADGASILDQLGRLHALHKDQTLGEIEKEVKIKAWSLKEETCPAVGIQATKFQSLRFGVPLSLSSVVVLDAPSFEFQVGTASTQWKFSLWDYKHPVVRWAKQTRIALAQCKDGLGSGPVLHPDLEGSSPH
jgi:hypothetical protein